MSISKESLVRTYYADQSPRQVPPPIMYRPGVNQGSQPYELLCDERSCLDCGPFYNLISPASGYPGGMGSALHANFNINRLKNLCIQRGLSGEGLLYNLLARLLLFDAQVGAFHNPVRESHLAVCLSKPVWMLLRDLRERNLPTGGHHDDMAIRLMLSDIRRIEEQGVSRAQEKPTSHYGSNWQTPWPDHLYALYLRYSSRAVQEQDEYESVSDGELFAKISQLETAAEQNGMLDTLD